MIYFQSIKNLPKTVSACKSVNNWVVLTEEKFGDNILSLWLFRGYRDFFYKKHKNLLKGGIENGC